MTIDPSVSKARTVRARCEACGVTFEKTIGKAGRPRVYCSTDCKDLAFALQLVSSKLAAVCDRLTPERADAIRSDLFASSNLCNYAKRRGKARAAVSP